MAARVLILSCDLHSVALVADKAERQPYRLRLRPCILPVYEVTYIALLASDYMLCRPQLVAASSHCLQVLACLLYIPDLQADCTILVLQ